MMKRISTFLIITSVYFLAACEHLTFPPGSANKNKTAAPAPIVQGPYAITPDGRVDTAGLMSAENVIVYPLDGPIDRQRMTFPEYRGVLANTTAGGYTVFDQSVTVFPVEGAQAGRPSYLPEYAVPKYAEQYTANAMRQAEPASHSPRGPLMPMDGDRTVTAVDIEPLTRTVPAQERPWLSSERGPRPVTARSPEGRRSGPVLTGY